MLQPFQLPTRIIFGENSISRLKKFVPPPPEGRSLLVCGNHLLKTEILNKIRKDLPDLKILSGIRPEPSLEEVKKYWSEIEGENFSSVIAIGGGSILDVSKILAAKLTNPEEEIENFIGVEKIKNKAQKLIAIPTTSGSGSEITKYAVIKKNKLKMTVVSEKIYPEVAILDPSLTITLPKDLTAYTSLDALTHNLEAYISKKSTFLTDIFAIEGTRLGLKWIERAYEDGKNLKARRGLALASLFGGIAITNASAGIVHALSHVLGAFYKIPHGLANAIFLPKSVKFNYNEKIKELEKELNIKNLPNYLEILNEKLGIPSLGEIIEDETKIKMIAERAYENRRVMSVNPKKIKLKDLKRVVEWAM
jgi:alcohol dehydrogenase class IV